MKKRLKIVTTILVVLSILCVVTVKDISCGIYSMPEGLQMNFVLPKEKACEYFHYRRLAKDYILYSWLWLSGGFLGSVILGGITGSSEVAILCILAGSGGSVICLIQSLLADRNAYKVLETTKKNNSLKNHLGRLKLILDRDTIQLVYNYSF